MTGERRLLDGWYLLEGAELRHLEGKRYQVVVRVTGGEVKLSAAKKSSIPTSSYSDDEYTFTWLVPFPDDVRGAIEQALTGNSGDEEWQVISAWYKGLGKWATGI